MMQHLCRELFVCDVVREGYYMRALSTYSVISRCCPYMYTSFSSFPKLWQIWHFLTWVSNLTAYFCCISRCSLKLLKRRRSLSSRNTLDLFLQTLFFGYNHHIHVGLNTKNFFPLHKYVVYHQLCSSAERKDSHSSRHVFLIWTKIRQKLSQVSSLWITQNLYAKINEKNNLE